ncbi:MAG: YceH family protein [Acidobacteriota bacterium]
MAHTRLLDEIEQRILGALMEKEQATPDHYPLTVSALLAACNQKSNREPVLSLAEDQIVEALDRLRRDVLVWRQQGPRSEKWQHCLTNRWHLSPPALAVMTLLLLRGPQTPGELRSRSGRLHAFDSVDDVEVTLARLAAGDDPLVEELARTPGQREARWRHVMGEPSAEAQESAGAATPAAVASQEGDEDHVADLERRVASLERRLARLESELS